MAIWVGNIKMESKLRDNVVDKSLKSLLALKMIKEVPHIQFKDKKHYIATEFKPSNEVTGGSRYKDGKLDEDTFGAVSYRYSPAVITPIPCIVCPRISQCTSDGIICPSTCVYYTEWLTF